MLLLHIEEEIKITRSNYKYRIFVVKTNITYNSSKVSQGRKSHYYFVISFERDTLILWFDDFLKSSLYKKNLFPKNI